MRFRFSLMLVAGLLALAGCASQPTASRGPIVLPNGEVLPAPVDGGPSTGGGVTAGAALGDLTTLDPCGLVDPNRMHGAHFSEPQPSALDTCSIDVTSGQAEAFVLVGPLIADDNQPAGTALTDGLRLAKKKQTSDHCEMRVEFADHIDLSVTTQDYGQAAGMDLCDFATQAANAAAGLAVEGNVHHLTVAPNSFDSVDPCTLLTPAMRAAAQLPAPMVGHFPQRHECEWLPNSAALQATVLVNFDLGTVAGMQAPPATTEQLAGFTTYEYTNTIAGTTTCYLRTPRGPYADGSGVLEVATLEVAVRSTDPQAACDPDRSIATILWPALPQQ